MRALTASEVQVFRRYATAVTLTQVHVTGFITPNVTLALVTSGQVPPPTQSALAYPSRRYRNFCNPGRWVVATNIWANESPPGPDGKPKLYTIGYIPKDKTGALSTTSGITLGYGIDIGKLGPNASAISAQLTTWGMSSPGLTTLTPYLGLYGPALSTVVAQLGYPTISTLDAQTVSKNAMSSYIAQASSQFGKLNSNIGFEQLPSNVQTALTDLVYLHWTLTSPGLPQGFSAALANSDLTTAGQLLVNTNDPRNVGDGNLLKSGQAQIPKPGQIVTCGYNGALKPVRGTND